MNPKITKNAAVEFAINAAAPMMNMKMMSGMMKMMMSGMMMTTMIAKAISAVAEIPAVGAALAQNAMTWTADQ